MKLYGADVFAFCERFLKHRAPADDVHQKTFIQAYESLGSFEGKSRLRTWLLGIAYNRCLDEIKVIIREVSRRADEDPDDRPAEKVASADARLHSARRAVALTGCIDELAPRIRAAVLMRYQEELSYEEMAEAMGQRAGTLRVRVARAMAALRQCLDRKGFAA